MFSNFVTHLDDSEIPMWMVLFIPPVLVSIFGILWCGLCWLIGAICGWRKLAQRYFHANPASFGSQHEEVSGKVGFFPYNKLLQVTLTDQGFFLEIMVLFRVGHPRLFIPWDEVYERHQTRLGFRRATELGIGTPVLVSITLPEDVVDDVIRSF
jgi:hypothetical protein